MVGTMQGRIAFGGLHLEIPGWCSPPTAAVARRCLLRLQDGGVERQVELSGKAFYTLGREGADIELKATMTSRSHAIVLHNGEGETFIADVGSTHGTFLGERRVPALPDVTLWPEGEVVAFGAAAGSGRDQRAEATLLQVDVRVPAARKSLSARQRVPAPEFSPFASRQRSHGDPVLAALRSPEFDRGLAMVTGEPLRPALQGAASVSKPEGPPPAKRRRSMAPVVSESLCLSPPSAPSASSRSLVHAGAAATLPESGAGLDAAAAPARQAGIAGGTRSRRRCSVAASTAASAGQGGGAAVSAESPRGKAAAEVASPDAAAGPAASAAPVVATKKGSKKAERCDKCDGAHATDECPHFQKPREQHKDAWASYGKKTAAEAMGSAGRNYVLKDASVCRQPGDGSCLYHSLSHGLVLLAAQAEKKDLKGSAKAKAAPAKRQNNAGIKAKAKEAAKSLRRELARFVKDHPSLKIAGDSLEEWVRWDSRVSCQQYARRMAMGGWGGGIEMAACSHLKQVNVHVYERNAQKKCEFKRISCFNINPRCRRTIHVLYQGRMHYDSLVPKK
eukprot:TRINITY_DN8035_c0_g2_i1.p1 TRINITY_DN8035_c0_g2~~TRINITY_DN8035_c0_g2_i1.p1  ORF type:complete len:563 (+),score=118.01 TRINITY_DN8035_c0_g2_i1:87-1775(+)